MRARLSVVLVAALLATGVIAPFGTGPAGAATAGFRGVNWADGTGIDQYVCSGGTNQQWSRSAV